MTKTLICFALSLLFLEPAGAQEKDSRRLLRMLRDQQREAAKQLNERMKSMRVLIEDLRRSNQNGKADLLGPSARCVVWTSWPVRTATTFMPTARQWLGGWRRWDSIAAEP